MQKWLFTTLLLVNPGIELRAAESDVVQFGPELHQGSGWAVFAPQGWRKHQIPNLDLYLRGDGITAMPLLDASFSPLMVGIVIDRNFPPGFTLKGLAGLFKKQQEEDKNMKVISVEEVVLPSGLRGKLAQLRIVKDEGRRMSFNWLLVWMDKQEKAIGLTAYATVAIDSEGFLQKSGIIEFLRGQVMLTGENKELVSYKLAEYSYLDFNRGLSLALATAHQANEFVLEGKWDKSIELFEKALAMFEPIHAAHNGLAWALMKRGRSKADLKVALTHAERAVELTEGKSEAALDTLQEVRAASK